MYQPLPSITEGLETLQARLRHERNPKRKVRLHLLVLLKSGQVVPRSQAAAHLALHRNTVALWLRRYRAGGLDALLTYKAPGAPAGQKSLPPTVFEHLKARLNTPTGFASYLEVQQWLRNEYGVEVGSKTVHGLVRYQLGAKLKRPRPRHAKKIPRKRLISSSSLTAASAPSYPWPGSSRSRLCACFARMKAALDCTSPCPAV